jgi:hypothetical protein
MRVRFIALIVPPAFLAGLAALSLTQGQDPLSLPGGTLPQGRPNVRGGQVPPPSAFAGRDLAKLAPLTRQMYLSAQSAADWLHRANRPDGRFEHGFLPSLKTKLEGDHYLRQAGAAFALARAARMTGDERHAAVARQAVLTLLLDTTTAAVPTRAGTPAAGSPLKMRHTTLPSVVVNRLAAAGLLLLAIHALPNPADDLLEQSEELCRYIEQQQQADGSLSFCDNPTNPKEAAGDPDGINHYPGQALHGLMRSQEHRPAAWKSAVVSKALAYYRPWWQKNKNMAFVSWQTAAYSEAFLCAQGKERAYADFVFEMSDWLCGLQYTMLDPRHPLWLGGFMGFADGKPLPEAPHVHSACFAEALAEACRVAKQAGDLPRYQRYRESLERCLQFLSTLQYTDGNTQHFAEWYRPRLVGGFHASHQDGTLRIDYTQHAIGALVQYLTYVAE